MSLKAKLQQWAVRLARTLLHWGGTTSSHLFAEEHGVREVLSWKGKYALFLGNGGSHTVRTSLNVDGGPDTTAVLIVKQEAAEWEATEHLGINVHDLVVWDRVLTVAELKAAGKQMSAMTPPPDSDRAFFFPDGGVHVEP